MIIEEYLTYHKSYREKYGDKCIVLMQVGSFFELYSIEDDISNYIYNIADICHIQISRKNKSITEVSLNNPLMAGFPIYTISKFTNILLNHNYTIVLVEQVTDPPNPQRKVTDILSPGMNINVDDKKSNYMLLLYFEIINNLPIVGISGIDLSTGNSFVFEAGSSKFDVEFSYDEVFRIISIYNPCEVILLSDKQYCDYHKTNILKNIKCHNTLIHDVWENFEYLTLMKNILYQNDILQKAFPNHNMLSTIENLNIEKYHHGRIALCCLLQFAYEHNVNIVKNLNKPIILNDTKYLNIEFNSVLQLNIISNDKNEKPLIDILNKCCTSFGSRYFKDILLNPIVDIDILNDRYDQIDFVLNNNNFIKIMKHLKGILDIERIKRKMILEKFNPQDWIGFHTSVENCILILDNFYNKSSFEYQEMINYYRNILDFNEVSKYNLNDIKGNIFKVGIYENIDELVVEFQTYYNKIKSFCDKINSIDDGDNTLCKLDYSDKDGFHISMTKKRFDYAKQKNNDFMIDFTIKSQIANNVRIINKDILNSSMEMDRIQNVIINQVRKYYQDFVKTFVHKYSNIIDDLIIEICKIDVACSNAYNAYHYRYYRPKIQQTETSFINAKYVRHPIIERINDNIEYIGNDVDLNCHKNGMLLYGINSSGKSSYMKSIGLNIVMAQAGMFVASHDFTFNPYYHLFTRISGMDNIYKGLSSFTVEMSELRNIMQRCDRNSIVLGDEICNGTEIISALSIVSSSIDTLIKKNTAFIFATHLHDLIKIKTVNQYVNKNIFIKHIHISFEENGVIKYERILKDGKGIDTYGLEVCKSLDMPNDFMKVAENVRKEIDGLDNIMLNPKKSKYNNKLFLNECKICGEKAYDTHHIEYQCKSDENGNFQNFHQNIKHNLVALCKSCHKKEHNGEISIKGFEETSNGLTLNYTETPFHIDTESHSIQDEDIKKIKQYIKKGKLHWFFRNNKTNSFQECSNIEKIQKKIRQLSGKIIDVEKIEHLVFDPMY